MAKTIPLSEATAIVARSTAPGFKGIRFIATVCFDGTWIGSHWFPGGGREAFTFKDREEAIAYARKLPYPVRIYGYRRLVVPN